MKTNLNTALLVSCMISPLVLVGCGGSSATNTQTTSTNTVQPNKNVVVPVSNSGLTFELEFIDRLKLKDGKQKDWSDDYQKPYIEAANKWLNALTAVEGKSHHTIRMKIHVKTLKNGNGEAGPDAEEKVGSFSFATVGTLIVGNHTYAQGFDQEEFNANILHEMGHIIGIGSSTENFMEYYAPLKGNVLKVKNSIAAQKYNEIYGNNYQYVPLSDDGGHLYDYIRQEDKKRILDSGKILPPLTKEFMANGSIFGAVTLAVLDDIGFEVSYGGVDSYTP